MNYFSEILNSIIPASLLQKEFAKDNVNFENFMSKPNFYEMCKTIIEILHDMFLFSSKDILNFEGFMLNDYYISVKAKFNRDFNVNYLLEFFKKSLSLFRFEITLDENFDYLNLHNLFLEKNKDIKRKAFDSMNDILNIFKNLNLIQYMNINEDYSKILNKKADDIIFEDNVYVIDYQREDLKPVFINERVYKEIISKDESLLGNKKQRQNKSNKKEKNNKLYSFKDNNDLKEENFLKLNDNSSNFINYNTLLKINKNIEFSIKSKNLNEHRIIQMKPCLFQPIIVKYKQI